MRISKILSTVVLGASLIFSSQAMAAEQIVVNGSTTVLPVMQKAAEAYMAANPNIQIAISGGGSGNGIKALIDSLCDIAMSSRDIKESEVKLAQKNGVEPQRIAVAIDALVPVVNPANMIKELSSAQLKDIFNGKITNWEEVGGKDAPIVVISRDTSSGTYETWSEKILKKDRVTPRALLQASNGAVAQAVSSNPNAIGYVGFGYLNSSIKALMVNGVSASQQSALDGSWSIARELYVFTGEDVKPEIKDFIAYLIHPEKGQKAVEEVGFIKLQK